MTLDPTVLHDYRPDVLSYVRSLLPRSPFATIEDLTSDTIEKALRSAHRFEDQGDGPRPWLIRIARNVVIDHVRRQRPTALHIPGIIRCVADAGSARQVDVIDVRAALAKLPERERGLLLRRYRDGHDMIAASGAQSKCTAHRWHRAALAAFAAEIAP